ncbi:MAG TPA: DUF4469 domain-containing protein [Clostridiaceae bacterium]|nr:DUF4469 domain-containing protein [Clostridiaceae bacterium]
MKKFLCILISLLLVLSTCTTAVFAKNYKSNNKWETKYIQELKKLRNELEKWMRNPKKRYEILQNIINLKKTYNDNSISIFVNGEEFEWEDSPVIKYGNFQLPVKPISKGLKAELSYNSKTNVITITKDGMIVVIDMKNKKVTINGNEIETDIFKNSNTNKTIVLIKFIASILGCRVHPDEDSGTIIIDDEDYITVNDSDSLITYKGSWKYEQNVAGAYNNDIHKSNKKNSSFSVKFSGTKIKVYGTTGPDHGIAFIKIDGRSTKVDLYSKEHKSNVLIYISPELKNGTHKLEVEVSGSKNKKSKNKYVTVDKIEIAGETTIIKGTDVALNKTAVADSQESWNPASHGNDGKLDTRWCANDKEPGHWWMVDLGAVYNLTGAQIAWEFPNKVYKYKIEGSIDGSKWFVLLDKTNNTSTQQVQTDSFKSKSARYVRVVVTGLEAGCWASFWDFKIFSDSPALKDTRAPSVPTGLTATPVSTSQINLKWNASTDNVGVAGYKVYRNGQHIATVTDGTTYNDTGLQPATVYKYAVSAFDAAGNNSARSAAVSAATHTPEITNIAYGKTATASSEETGNTASKANDNNLDTRWCANNGNTGHWWMVDLGGEYRLTGSEITWEKEAKVYKYKIEASLDGSLWITVADRTGNTSAQQVQKDDISITPVRYVRVTVTGLEPGCWASIRECKIFGYPAVQSDKQAPSVPSNLIVKPVSSNRIDISWSASTDNVGVAGYKVYRNGTQVATVTNGLTYSDTELTAGTAYEYTVKAYDAAGNESAATSPVKAATFGNGVGLTGYYYDDMALSADAFKLARTDPVIDFNWDYGSPDSSIGTDTFSVRWTGQIQPLYTEKYTFHTISDDGIRVWINGKLVIDHWSDHSAEEKTGSIDLVAGQKYDITVEYYENGGQAVAKLLWSSASQAKEIIPQSQLYLP